MDKNVKELVQNYCKNQGIELENLEQVVNQVDDEINVIIANTIHEQGTIKESENE